MDIQNTPYKDIARIIYPYYFDWQTKRKDKAIQAFEIDNFKALNDMHPYIKKERKEYFLKAAKLSKVLNELQSFKLPEHCTEPEIISECQCDYESRFVDDDIKIKLVYYQYSVPDFDFRPGIAKHISENFAWKIKHQPNGNDAKKALEILKRYI